MTHLRLVLHSRCELQYWRRVWRTSDEISLGFNEADLPRLAIGIIVLHAKKDTQHWFICFVFRV